MNPDADYQAVLADLKRRRDEFDAAIKTVEGIIAQLGPTSSNSGKIRSVQDIPSDAFLTLTIPEAAIKYLGLVRSAQTVAQIWEALKTGGLPHTKYNAVYNALLRREAQVEDIVKLPDGSWGLTEWYPRTPSPARKARRSVNTVAVPSEKQEMPPTGDAKRLTMVDAAEQILREAGKPLHATELVEKLRAYGRNTNIRSVAASLPQDSKKRFTNLGKNTWALEDKSQQK